MKHSINIRSLSTLVAVLFLAGCSNASAPVADTEAPAIEAEQALDFPVSGTVFITPDVITPDSVSDLISVTFKGIEEKETFDRRVNDWVTHNSLVFTASFRCALPSVDVVVNPEFTQEQALAEANRFAKILGQLPVGSRTKVRELWIHEGDELAGGGNDAISVHTGYAATERDYIEEVFVHEAAHTSLDYEFGGAVDEALWKTAQAADGEFISTYARDEAEREDIAESYGAFMIWAVGKEQGLFSGIAGQIESVIPSRLAYFTSLGPDFGPLPASCG